MKDLFRDWRILSVCLVVGTACLAIGLSQYSPKSVSSREENRFLWPGGNRVAVSITFDDGRPSQLDNGLPILNKYGVKATFYVNPGNITDRLEEWKLVLSQGHEIGNHTSTHPCTGNFVWSRDNALEFKTLDDLAQEMETANEAIQRLLGVLPRTFAYPCGQKFVGSGREAVSYVPLVAEKFLVGRGWLNEGANDPNLCDLAQVLGVEFDGLSFEEAKEWIDRARDNGHWLVFCGHDIGGPARQTTLDTVLDLLCRYSLDRQNGIWIGTVEQVGDYIAKRRSAR